MPYTTEVSALLRAVASEVVLPRFQRLAAHEIAEKSPGELVTAADLEAEFRLADGLASLCPEARIVGEEAAADDPSLLDHLDEGLLWLIDPIDGTGNFAAGREPFGMMVALVDNGTTLASWILAPSVGKAGRLAYAEYGCGATIDDELIITRPTGRCTLVAALGTHFLTSAQRAKVHAVAERTLNVQPVPRCAAESYVRLALGHDDIALFQRTLPWDHAAGALFLREAGGVVTDWHGKPWHVGTTGPGILAATTQQAWETGADALLTREAGLPIPDMSPETCLS